MPVTISKVWFDEQNIFVELSGKQIISVPLSTYPRLQHATSQQRNCFELWNDGKCLHWEELDEDLSAQGFAKYSEAEGIPASHV